VAPLPQVSPYTTPCSSSSRTSSPLAWVKAASIAALLLAGGAPEKRFALPNARVLIHQPWMSGLGGQATDIDLHAKEILRMRTTINKLLPKHTRQSIDRIEKDVERDFIMNPEQAKEYGMIDEIIYKHR
jgi:ATP-dependent Clp protease, protease subunit